MGKLSPFPLQADNVGKVHELWANVHRPRLHPLRPVHPEQGGGEHQGDSAGERGDPRAVGAVPVRAEVSVS